MRFLIVSLLFIFNVNLNADEVEPDKYIAAINASMEKDRCFKERVEPIPKNLPNREFFACVETNSCFFEFCVNRCKGTSEDPAIAADCSGSVCRVWKPIIEDCGRYKQDIAETTSGYQNPPGLIWENVDYFRFVINGSVNAGRQIVVRADNIEAKYREAWKEIKVSVTPSSFEFRKHAGHELPFELDVKYRVHVEGIKNAVGELQKPHPLNSFGYKPQTVGPTTEEKYVWDFEGQQFYYTDEGYPLHGILNVTLGEPQLTTYQGRYFGSPVVLPQVPTYGTMKILGADENGLSSYSGRWNRLYEGDIGYSNQYKSYITLPDSAIETEDKTWFQLGESPSGTNIADHVSSINLLKGKFNVSTTSTSELGRITTGNGILHLRTIERSDSGSPVKASVSYDGTKTCVQATEGKVAYAALLTPLARKMIPEGFEICQTGDQDPGEASPQTNIFSVVLNVSGHENKEDVVIAKNGTIEVNISTASGTGGKWELVPGLPVESARLVYGPEILPGSSTGPIGSGQITRFKFRVGDTAPAKMIISFQFKRPWEANPTTTFNLGFIVPQ